MDLTNATTDPEAEPAVDGRGTASDPDGGTPGQPARRHAGLGQPITCAPPAETD